MTKKGANKLKRLDPSQHKTVTEEIEKITQEEEEGDNEDSSDDEAGDAEDKQESEDEGVHSGSEEPMGRFVIHSRSGGTVGNWVGCWLGHTSRMGLIQFLAVAYPESKNPVGY